MKTIQFERLNRPTLAEGNLDQAIAPLGSCDSHSDHLPFGTDAIIARKLALEVGKRVSNSLVQPPTWCGTSMHYRHRPTTITLGSDTDIRVIREILRSLIFRANKKILTVNGHDDNISCLDVACRDVKNEHP